MSEIEPKAQEANTASQETTPARQWETITLGSELFKVKRDLLVTHQVDGNPVDFVVDYYAHPESQTQIAIYKLGLDRPLSDPAITRIDYGCPCMTVGSDRFTFPGHDCKQQRDLMFQTVADLGIGAIAIVDEHTTAGNGHGPQVVYEQADIQNRARKNGQEVPSMPKTYSQLGYHPFDTRPHNMIALALAHSIGTQRTIIPAMTNQKKIQELSDTSMNVSNNLRVELHTNIDPDTVNLLQRDGFHRRLTDYRQGAYVIDRANPSNSMLLNADTYPYLSSINSYPQPARRVVN